MDSWRREHRPAARDLFARELAEAGDLIAAQRRLHLHEQARPAVPPRAHVEAERHTSAAIGSTLLRAALPSSPIA
jgi:hypothetical protein